MQFNCRFCAEFRELINQILGPITNNNFNNCIINPSNNLRVNKIKKKEKIVFD